MEQLPKKNQAERFFEDNVRIEELTTEEFLSRVKAKYPETPEEEILEMKGLNFDENDKTVILIRSDTFPTEYLPYLETHEKWEAYVARKRGYNLYNKAVREYRRKDNEIEDFSDERKKSFYKELQNFRYEFRHEYAIYKEYEQALKDGKLDKYHAWIMQQRPDASEMPLWMGNDTKIRESIYQKLKEGTSHHFLR